MQIDILDFSLFALQISELQPVAMQSPAVLQLPFVELP
jgi:hypothetical protein